MNRARSSLRPRIWRCSGRHKRLHKDIWGGRPTNHSFDENGTDDVLLIDSSENTHMQPEEESNSRLMETFSGGGAFPTKGQGKESIEQVDRGREGTYLAIRCPALKPARYPRSTLMGICLDYGTVRSVAGFEQTVAFSDRLGTHFDIRASNNRFGFGSRTFKRLGVLTRRIQLRDVRFLPFMCDIVRADIPVLLAQDVIRTRVMTSAFHEDVMWSIAPPCELKIYYQLGHAFNLTPQRVSAKNEAETLAIRQ